MMEPVIKEVTVQASRDVAFRRFTEEISTWWPGIAMPQSIVFT